MIFGKKKAILESFNVIFKFYITDSNEHLFGCVVENIDFNKEFSKTYDFGCVPYDFVIMRDLIKELTKDEKRIDVLNKHAKKLLIKHRKKGYSDLKQGTVVRGKHIIKVLFDFENVKYRMEKVKKK